MVNCTLFLDAPKEASLLLVLKWGGELTPSGRIQAEELGRVFRCMYPGGQGKHLVHTKSYLISLIGCKWSFRFYNASSLRFGFSKLGTQLNIRKNGIFSKPINSKYVLTAAHCHTNEQPIKWVLKILVGIENCFKFTLLCF